MHADGISERIKYDLNRLDPLRFSPPTTILRFSSPTTIHEYKSVSSFLLIDGEVEVEVGRGWGRERTKTLTSCADADYLADRFPVFRHLMSNYISLPGVPC